FLTDAEPFHTVYLHGMIRAEGGIKMSKTRGNSVDPLDIVEEIGADALRVALVHGSAPGSDMRLTQAKLDGGRNFTNKLWNAARFVLANRPESAVPRGEPSLAARWIGSRLADATARATRQLDALDLGGYAATVYDAAWSDYCDWFLEMAKVDLRRDDAGDAERAATWAAAAEGLASLLRLLHPLMPFVTEEIWQALREAAPYVAADPLLIIARWPPAQDQDPRAESAFADLAALVRGVRGLRTEAGTPASAWAPLSIEPSDDAADAALRADLRYLEALARVRPIELVRDGAERPELVAAGRLGVAWLAQDGATEMVAAGRRQAQLAEMDANIARLEQLLANTSFTDRAPAVVVERERTRLADLREQRGQLAREAQ
ncbi:MAG: valyl-tRNA synthetase, partial [Chloroflexota bacterium]|nr:valyl-tRNA synthetase [Chloroflexota bacterium]